MQFEPKTREQAEEASKFPVWPAGNYDYEIAKAEEQVSKKGNDMIKLTLNVYNDAGQVQVVFDYLMAAFPLKLIDACEAMELMDKYNAGNLSAYDLENKRGVLRLAIKPKSKNKDTGEEFSEKNEVNTYIAQSGKTSQSSDEFEIDDELPF